MIEQFPAKATSIILASAEEEHGFNMDVVKREAFHGRGDRDVVTVVGHAGIVSAGECAGCRFTLPPNWSPEEGSPSGFDIV
jgi:hypothetical protein